MTTKKNKTDATTPELPVSKLTKSQTKTFRKSYTEGKDKFSITVTARYDDECGNGHNSFALTADIRMNGREYMGGCCHEEIAKHFPDLAPYIKWHLTSADGPMHYVANTLWHAGDRDHNGRTKGERYHVKGHEEKRVVFGEFPISFDFKEHFTKFIEEVKHWSTAEPVAVAYENRGEDTYKFDPKWTIKADDYTHTNTWHECPFDRQEEAQDFIRACQMFTPKIVVFQDKYTKVGEGKERDLDAARSCAVWPEATDEELCQEPEKLKAALLARLPALMQAFKADMEKLGFTY